MVRVDGLLFLKGEEGSGFGILNFNFWEAVIANSV
jgi:hypothetical protein